MNGEKKRLWNLLWVVLAIGVFYITSNVLMMLSYETIPRYLIPVKQEQAQTYLLLADTITSTVLLGFSFVAFRLLREKPEGGIQPLSGRMFGQCAVIGAAVFGINTFLQMLLHPTASGGMRESFMSMFLFGVLFAPLIEECFFRGVVYNLLSRFKGGWFSVVCSAVLFGAYHMDLYQAIYTTLLGLALALVYQRTHRLAYAIAIHMANNACACLAVGVIPASGQMAFGIVTLAMAVPAGWFLLKPRREAALQ